MSPSLKSLLFDAVNGTIAVDEPGLIYNKTGFLIERPRKMASKETNFPILLMVIIVVVVIFPIIAISLRLIIKKAGLRKEACNCVKLKNFVFLCGCNHSAH